MKGIFCVWFFFVWASQSWAAGEWQYRRCNLEYGHIAGSPAAALPVLEALDKKIVELALDGPSPGLSRKLLNLIGPLHPRVAKLLAFNESSAARRFHAAELEMLLRENRAGLTPEETATIDGLRVETIAEMVAADADFKRVYGDKGMSSRDDIYAAYDRVKTFDERRATAAFLTRAGTRFDTAMKIVDAARARNGLPPRTLAEIPDREMQFRHLAQLRETLGAQGWHDQTTGRASPYPITVYYSYWKRRIALLPDAKGHLRRTVVHDAVAARYSRRASFRELLTGDFKLTAPRGEVLRAEGVEAAKEAGSPLRGREAGYYRTLEQAQREIFEAIRESHPPVTSRASLAATLAELKEYSAWPEARIREQWVGDDYVSFKLRTGALVARYEALLKYDELYREQLRRGGPLVARPAVADFKPELTELERRARRNRNLLLTSLLGGGPLAALGGKNALDTFAEDERKRLRERDEDRRQRPE